MPLLIRKITIFWLTIVFSIILATSCCFAGGTASQALDEFDSLKTKTFQVSSSTKKLRTHFQICYPESWGAVDSKRPGVIKRIASPDTNDIASLVIIANKWKGVSDSATADEVFDKKFFKNAKIAEFLPGAKAVRAERCKEPFFDGAIFEYYWSVQLDEPVGTMRMYVVDYAFVQNGVMVQLQFFTHLGKEDDKKADEARISSFRPVWKAFISTLKFKD